MYGMVIRLAVSSCINTTLEAPAAVSFYTASLTLGIDGFKLYITLLVDYSIYRYTWVLMVCSGTVVDHYIYI